MMPPELLQVVNASPYPLEAFLFVQRGLDHTVRRIHGEPSDQDDTGEGQDVPSRHVDGRELCHGLRDFATEQYGLLAQPILARWGITRTDDFGRIVFAMVDGGLMHKTDEDSARDFAGVYDFDAAFNSGLMLSEEPAR